MNWLQALVAPIVGAFTNWNDRKRAAESAKAKIKLARENNNHELNLTDAEWEALGKRAESDGWKDEWVTLVVTLPILVVFVAAFFSALLDNPTYVEAANAGVAAIKELLPNFHQILEVVVYAAVSIKGIQVLTKR